MEWTTVLRCCFFPCPEIPDVQGLSIRTKMSLRKANCYKYRDVRTKSCLQFSTLHIYICQASQLSIGYLEWPEPEPDRLVIFGYLSTVLVLYSV